MNVNKKFLAIEEEYWKFEEELMRTSKLPFKDTERGIWGSITCDDAFEIFKKINLKKYKNFLDLGSGDGRAVLIASLFTKATGIEFDKELHDKGIEIRDKLKIDAELINDDYFNYDLSEYDIIFVNPDKGFEYEIEDKLLRELKGVLVVYNNVFLPRFFKKKKTIRIDNVPTYIFEKK